MTNDLYELDIDTMTWRKVLPGSLHPNDAASSSSSSAGTSPSAKYGVNVPKARYFHSADLWRGKLIICGGMGYPHSANASSKAAQDGSSSSAGGQASKADGLSVLDETIALDLKTMQWELDFHPGAAAATSGKADAEDPSLLPMPRYAHLSCITSDHLVILGGQDIENKYVEQINVFDLNKRKWVRSDPLNSQCGSYRSLAVSSPWAVQDEDGKEQVAGAGLAPITRPCWLPPQYEAGPPAGSRNVGAANGSPLRSRSGSLATSESSRHPPPAYSSPADAADMDPSRFRSASISSEFSAARSPAAQQKFVAAPPPAEPRFELHPLPMSVKRPTIPARRPTTPETAAKSLQQESAEEGQAKEAEDSSLKLMPIYVYSNYNFADVKRELEQVQYTKDYPTSPSPTLAMQDLSSKMVGPSLPPGLRFPNGFILGNYLIISGTYLANTSQTFSIWALHLPTLTWSRMDAGSVLAHGSWNRAILWPKTNRLLVLGNRERDLVADYNHRQRNWDHMAVLELEPWGIYQPPACHFVRKSVTLGLEQLGTGLQSAWQGLTMSRAHAASGRAASEASSEMTSEIMRDADEISMKGSIANSIIYTSGTHELGSPGDFEIVCSDGTKIGTSRMLLERRWPWFKRRMLEFRERATDAIATGDQATPARPLFLKGAEVKADIRITPRQLIMPEPAPVVIALMEFFHTKTICTSLQRHPSMLATLLIVGSLYQMEDLSCWAAHGIHQTLFRELSPPSRLITQVDAATLPPDERHRFAVLLYEAASLCGNACLQVRALRVVMALSKWIARRSESSLPRNQDSASGTGPPMALTSTKSTQASAIGRVLPPQLAIPAPPTGVQVTQESVSVSTPTEAAFLDADDAEEPSTARPVRGQSKAERLLGITPDPPSKAERLLGLGGGEGSKGPGSAAPTSVNQRRPSGAAEAPGSSLTVRQSAAKKRFSIFGRVGKDDSDAGSATQSTGHDDFDTRSASNSSLSRVNTNDSGPTPIRSPKPQPRSGASAEYAPHSDLVSSSAALPPPALSAKEGKRVEKEEREERRRLEREMKSRAAEAGPPRGPRTPPGSGTAWSASRNASQAGAASQLSAADIQAIQDLT